MFKWKPADYSVGEPRQIMEPVTGPSSILLLDGERHLRMRKLMLPPFHGEAIARFSGLIEEITEREIASWRPGAKIRTRTVAQAITMEVIIRAVFGITDAARVEQMKRLLPRLSSINPLLAIEGVRKVFKDDPAAVITTVSQNDVDKWCDCDNCKALVAKYDKA